MIAYALFTFCYSLERSDMKKEYMTNTFVVWIGALICCALWGSAFPCIKIGYSMMAIDSNDIATQILYAGYRFTLAGILAVIIGSVINHKLLVPNKKAVPKVFCLSLFQTVLQYLFFYGGLAHTDGTKASIIEGTNVFVAIIISSLFFRMEKVGIKKILGCIIGFAGVVLVNIPGNNIDFNMSINGEGFIFFSTIAYAFSSVLLKRYSKEENTVMLSGWQFVVGGVIMTITGLLFGGRLTDFNMASVMMLVYLAIVSAVAYSLWSVLLTYNPVSKVTVFGFMNPVIGFILSAILLNEGNAVSVIAFASLLLVCIGIYIANGENKKEA